MPVIKTFNGTSEVELNSGTRILVAWEQLESAIQKAVMIRPDEHIKGYLIDEEGISVSIGRKSGRKVTVPSAGPVGE